jgi:hypothetical protein
VLKSRNGSGRLLCGLEQKTLIETAFGSQRERDGGWKISENSTSSWSAQREREREKRENKKGRIENYLII